MSPILWRNRITRARIPTTALWLSFWRAPIAQSITVRFLEPTALGQRIGDPASSVQAGHASRSWGQPQGVRPSCFNADPVPNAELINRDGSPTSLGQVSIRHGPNLPLMLAGAWRGTPTYVIPPSRKKDHQGACQSKPDSLRFSRAQCLRHGSWFRVVLVWVLCSPGCLRN
jgi:hypothetical protein